MIELLRVFPKRRVATGADAGEDLPDGSHVLELSFFRRQFAEFVPA